MRQGIKEKDIRDFEKYAEKLKGVMERINQYKPDAYAYLACNNLNLMSSDFNIHNRLEQKECIVTSIVMGNFDGGDF